MGDDFNLVPSFNTTRRRYKGRNHGLFLLPPRTLSPSPETLGLRRVTGTRVYEVRCRGVFPREIEQESLGPPSTPGSWV